MARIHMAMLVMIMMFVVSGHIAMVCGRDAPKTKTRHLLQSGLGNNTATAIAIGGRDGNNTHGGNNTSCNSALPRGNGGIATGDNGGNGGNGGDAVEGDNNGRGGGEGSSDNVAIGGNGGNGGNNGNGGNGGNAVSDDNNSPGGGNSTNIAIGGNGGNGGNNCNDANGGSDGGKGGNALASSIRG